MKLKKEVSIMEVNISFVVIIIFFSLGVLVGNHFLQKKYADAITAQETMLACTDAANALQNESDELTLCINNYVDTQSQLSMNNYYKVIDEQQREREIKKAKRYHVDCSALEKALALSDELSAREAHAFALIASANGTLENSPPQVRDYELSPEELGMPGSEKTELAGKLIHGKDYNDFKRSIYQNINVFENEVMTATRRKLVKESKDIFVYIRYLRCISLICNILSICLALILYKMVTLVLKRYVKSISMGEYVEASGVSELKYLANIFNNYISRHKQEQSELRQKANIDPLTEISNRRAFENFMSKALRTPESAGAFIFLDVDNFKIINDTYGHDIGDEILKILADRMKKTFKSNDFIARLGGDEFAIWLDKIGDKKLIDEKMSSLADLPFDLNGIKIQISLSAGVTFCRAGEAYTDILKRADIALYKKKRSGKNGCAFYELS